MTQTEIFYPVLTLALWTMMVLVLIPVSFFKAIAAKKARINDAKNGVSALGPDAVNIPNRNYMNLLEAPVLFYVGCGVLYAAQGVDDMMLGMAWVYVALRIAHSVIHLTTNKVMYRGLAFGLSNFTLMAMLMVAMLRLP